MKFIVDTDMGIDDALALLMILAQPGAEIEAITTVAGNIPLAQATHNAGVVLDIAAAPPVPIYQGCATPLMQTEPLHAMEVHASDGLGGAGRPHTDRPAEAEHASLALVRLARAKPGRLTLLTLGPLTNVALAIHLDPQFLTRFERIVLMAGAVHGHGNTTPAAEFNVAADPEAAQVVLNAGRRVADKVWLVSWEAALDHATPFARWRDIIAGASATARFVQQMTGFIERSMAAFGIATIPWADPLAAAVALDPAIVLNYDSRPITVEVGHNLARGQTIVSYLRRQNEPVTAKIVRQIDLPKFEQLLRLAVQPAPKLA